MVNNVPISQLADERIGEEVESRMILEWEKSSKCIEMGKARKFSLRSRVRSFGYACRGLQDFFLQEHNALLHLLATGSVVFFAVYFRIRGAELLALLIVTALVWITELINTAIEKIMDHLSPEQHPRVKYIKDLSAAAVFVAAVLALVTGIIVFTPEFFI